MRFNSTNDVLSLIDSDEMHSYRSKIVTEIESWVVKRPLLPHPYIARNPRMLAEIVTDAIIGDLRACSYTISCADNGSEARIAAVIELPSDKPDIYGTRGGERVSYEATVHGFASDAYVIGTVLSRVAYSLYVDVWPYSRAFSFYEAFVKDVK